MSEGKCIEVDIVEYLLRLFLDLCFSLAPQSFLGEELDRQVVCVETTGAAGPL